MTTGTDGIVIDAARMAAALNALTPAERRDYFVGTRGPTLLRELMIARTRPAFDPAAIDRAPWLAELAPVIQRALDALADDATSIMLDDAAAAVEVVWRHRDEEQKPDRCRSEWRNPAVDDGGNGQY